MKMIYDDLKACDVENPSFKDLVFYFFTHPEFKVVFYYRIYSSWYQKGGFKKALGKYLWMRVVKNSGCYISPKAKIGKGLRLPHATGIVIGDGAIIGDNALIYQHVTIGDKGSGDEYPMLKDNVTIYAGACVVGSVTLHDDVVIGANAVVLHDIPAQSTAVGVPAKILKKDMMQAI